MKAEVVVDLHQLDLDAQGELRSDAPLLDRLEHERADRFVDPRERRRFVARRAWMRRKLAGYLGARPQDLAFTATRLGKPALVGRPVEFSVSRSAGLAILAISRDRPVGCDLELDRAGDGLELARRFFSPREAAWIADQQGERRAAAFRFLWACKEAFLKAGGHGLSMPLDSFTLHLSLEGRASLGRGCQGWSLVTFEPWPDVPAAVVSRGRDWRLRPAAL